MTKPVIVTRSGKGVALTYEEQDANFTNLQNATITVSDGTNSKAIDLNGTIQFTAGSNITLSVNATTGVITINSSSGGMTDIVQDTSPQLGGNLDVNGKKIVSVTNGTVWLQPNGTGAIYLDCTGGGEIEVTGLIRLEGASTITDISGTLILSSSVGDITLSGDGLTLTNNTSSNPALTIQNSTTGTPSNTTTPATWLKVRVGSTTRYLPLYS